MNPVPEQAPQKKPYRTPLLVHYGNLSRITNTVGTTGLDDGGGMGMNKTRP